MFNFLGLSFLVLLPTVGAATVERVEYNYYKYHPMEEISSWMTQMVKDHPDLVTIEDYGQTYENRSITLLKIGIKTEAKKKAVWMDCGIHAREWIAPAFCQYFVKQILQTHETDDKIKEMMKNMDFYVTPVLNIDGYMFSWKNNTTRLWRKNRSKGPSSDCFGTDLNRNFNSNWGTVGVSFNCSSEIFCGTKATSESEAQAVTKFFQSRKDEFLCFLTIHSYGQLLLLPYGHPNYTASNYEELVDFSRQKLFHSVLQLISGPEVKLTGDGGKPKGQIEMKVGREAAEAIWKVHRQNYTVGTSPDVLYPNSGSSRDWAHTQGIPFTYTFELRDNGTFGFELPEDQIKPTCEEAYRGALHIITYAHDKTFNGAAVTAAATLWTLLLAVGVNLM